jgi:hypothetical protein
MILSENRYPLFGIMRRSARNMAQTDDKEKAIVPEPLKPKAVE